MSNRRDSTKKRKAPGPLRDEPKTRMTSRSTSSKRCLRCGSESLPTEDQIFEKIRELARSCEPRKPNAREGHADTVVLDQKWNADIVRRVRPGLRALASATLRICLQCHLTEDIEKANNATAAES